MAERCMGCGGLFPESDGPTHKYMLSVPGCWQVYGEVLAREYEDALLFSRSHQLTVDAYAIQHPGESADRRADQSVWLHFASLHGILGQGGSQRDSPALLKKLAGQPFPTPPEPVENYALTVADVAAADIADHPTMVRQWAEAAYRARRNMCSEVERLLSSL